MVRPVLQLCDLYENDCIFDKFDACVSPDGSAIATGTYSNNFKVIHQFPSKRRGECWLG